MGEPRQSISALRESSLHAALKAAYARRGDELEVEVDGYVIDLRRRKLLVEFQTRGFSSLKRKLTALLERHRVRLVHPIPREKWIVRITRGGHLVARRKSPKRGRVEHVFNELVSLAQLAAHPHFSLEVLLTRQEEVWRDDGRGSWRRQRWSVADHRLLDIVDRMAFRGLDDWQRLLPHDLPTRFSTADLARVAQLPRPLAQRMAYCLRVMEVVCPVGKRGHTVLYQRACGQGRAP